MSLVQLTIAALIATLIPTAESVAGLTHEDRPVTAFSAVKLVGSIDMVISEGQSDTLSIEGETSQVKDVRTEVHEGVLTVSYETGWSLMSWIRVPTAAPRAVLTSKALARIAVEGSGSVRAQTLTSQDKFEIQITGSGDVQVATLTARSIDVRIAGSGDVRLTGAALDEAVRIAGSGNFFGGDMKCATGKVSISGSGDAVLWVRDKLDVSISGSGDVQYFGTPAIAQSTAGSGTLKGLGAKT